MQKITLTTFLIAFVFACSSAQQAEPKQTPVKSKSRLPANYKVPVKNKSFEGEGSRLILTARRFAPGEAVLLQLESRDGKPCADCTIKLNGKEIPVVTLPSGGWGIAGIDPDEKKTEIELQWQLEGLAVNSQILKIANADFPVYHSTLNLGKYSEAGHEKKKESQDHLKLSWELKKNAYSQSDANHLGGSFFHPRDQHKITSPFWAKRVYARYRVKDGKKEKLKPLERIHRGTDLRGFEGTPVYAMNKGRIALAANLYYEGNFVLIDHGNKVYTGYMHLSRFEVQQGEIVEAGQLIGRCGSTGVVTAAHLHLFTMVHGVVIDGLSLLALTVPE